MHKHEFINMCIYVNIWDGSPIHHRFSHFSQRGKKPYMRHSTYWLVHWKLFKTIIFVFFSHLWRKGWFIVSTSAQTSLWMQAHMRTERGLKAHYLVRLLWFPCYHTRWYESAHDGAFASACTDYELALIRSVLYDMTGCGVLLSLCCSWVCVCEHYCTLKVFSSCDVACPP